MEEFAVGRPTPALWPWCVAYQGYRSIDVVPAVHRGLPSPWLTFIITLDDPLVVTVQPDPAQAPATYDALIGGLHTHPALITHDGRQSGIQLLLSPIGARALLGVPAGALATLDVHAHEVLGARVERVRAQLTEARTWPRRFALLDAALLGWLRDMPTPPDEVVHAWRLLRRGDTPAQTADQVGWSLRHLSQRLRSEAGVNAQTAARIVRFDRARRQLGARPSTRLDELAVTHGFYDQAHLNRDFRSFAGLPPAAWLAAEHIGIVQDARA